MKKDYIIWAPILNKSNGVRVLYQLYSELEKRGFNVYLYSKNGQTEGYKYVDKITQNIKKNSIVIYPEVVWKNPLRIQNVVRYVLNYPGVLGGAKKYHKSEKIFTYAKKYYPEADFLPIPTIDENLFFDEKLEKTQDCYFVYKNGKFRDAKETQNLLEINMEYPQTKEELAHLLKTTRILYSYDDCSSLLDEAELCGAKVKIITKDGVIDRFSDYKERMENYEKHLDNFIDITQKMNYRGRIERIGFSVIKRWLKAFIGHL